MRTWRNEEQIVEKSHKGGEFCSLKYRLRKGMKKEVITTRGIRFWSPIQVRIPQKLTGLNFVERTTRGAVLVV